MSTCHGPTPCWNTTATRPPGIGWISPARTAVRFEPVVAQQVSLVRCAGRSRHVTSTRLEPSGSGRIRLRERVQIGRSGEQQGFWSGSLHADADGKSVLQNRIELGTGLVADDELEASGSGRGSAFAIRNWSSYLRYA